MSYEAKYDPSNAIVPNVVTAWGEVDVPTGNPNTLNNPDTSFTGQPFPNSVVPYACTANPATNALAAFTSDQAAAWQADQQAQQQAAAQQQAVDTLANDLLWQALCSYLDSVLPTSITPPSGGQGSNKSTGGSTQIPNLSSATANQLAQIIQGGQ
jgi:hypothetical protein